MKMKVAALFLMSVSCIRSQDLTDEQLLERVFKSARSRRTVSLDQMGEEQSKQIATIAPTVPELEKVRESIGLLRKSLGDSQPQTVSETVAHCIGLLNALAEDLDDVLEIGREHRELIDEIKSQMSYVDATMDRMLDEILSDQEKKYQDIKASIAEIRDLIPGV